VSSRPSRFRLPRKPAPRRLPAEPRVHGGADVRELPFVHLSAGIAPLDVREQQRVLTGVIRRRCGRVAAVVGGEDQQIAFPELVEEVREPPVEVLQAAVEVDGVVPVPPEHVRLDEVHEDQSLVELAEELLRLRDPLDVRPRRVRFVDVDAGEDVADLPHAVHLVARVAHERQVVRLPRPQRPVVAVRRADVVPRLALEGSCDHAPDRVLPGQDLPRDLAAAVELVERDRVDVRGDLEDGICRGVDDPLPGSLMLLAELLDDLGAGRRLVPQHSAARSMHERIEHLEGETVPVGWKGLGRDHPHQLPVARRRVLALGSLEQAPGDGRRTGLRRAPLELFDVPEAERLEVREVEAADRLRDVSERVGTFVAEVGSVR
jgi:hypothetical protein